MRHDNTRHFILRVTPSLLPLRHTAVGSYQQQNTGEHINEKEMGKHEIKTNNLSKRKHQARDATRLTGYDNPILLCPASHLEFRSEILKRDLELAHQNTTRTYIVLGNRKT